MHNYYKAEMNTIILNTKNISNSGNNQLKYAFPTPKYLDKHQIAVASVQLFYSWFNISSTYQNNVYQYLWFDGQTYTVNIPDGFYTVQQLSAHLQATMIANNHYLVNSNTRTNVYFLEIVTNPSLYSCQINSYPLTQAQATTNGWTLPSSATWTIPSVATIPKIIMPSNNFQNVLGINAGTYPNPGTVSVTKIYSKASDFCPQVSPVNSLMISCSMLNSPYGNPTNILYSFAPDVAFGSLISIKAQSYAWNDISPSHYSEFTLTIVDQNLNPVNIIDPSIVITLLIRDKMIE